MQPEAAGAGWKRLLRRIFFKFSTETSINSIRTYWQNRLAGVSSLLRESGRIMRFFQIKRFLPGHPVWAGCILLPLFLILLWAGFVFYSRLQLEAAVRRQELQGIACSAPGLQKRVGSPDSAAFDLLMGSVRRIVEAAPEETQQWFQDLEPEELARFLGRSPFRYRTGGPHSGTASGGRICVPGRQRENHGNRFAV